MAERLSRWRLFWGAWLILLALSTAVRWLGRPASAPADDRPAVSVPRMVGWTAGSGVARIAYREAGPAGAPTIVMLHGSPGGGGQLWPVARLLADSFHVIVPDLPGFGQSSRDIPDQSLVAEAAYVRALLDSLHLPAVHLLGFSLGGGVAEELAARAPERVRSLTLLSAIGVQEFELLGDYHLNHALHGGQYALIWAVKNLVPHFGAWDGGMMDLGYARSFYEADQRPLRAALLGWQGPALVIHGTEDVLVPVAAAREHLRLLPQADSAIFATDHFMPFAEPTRLVAPIGAFVRKVEAGVASIRASADPARVAAAARPFDAGGQPSAQGFALGLVLVLLALATLLSEDLACVAAGVLAARGSVPLFPALIACYLGIIAGDQLLYLLGRSVGRAVVRLPPVSWLLSEEQLDHAAHWFERHGLRVVLTSRFIPGSRFPTYVAAGVLRAGFLRFAGYLAIAGALWTPALVGASYLAARSGRSLVDALPGDSWPWALAGVLALVLVARIAADLVTHRGRRLLYGMWRRWTRWEYWPRWLFYPPVVVYVLWLGLKHRSLTLFTAADPGIPLGGVVGESKSAILAALGQGDPRVAITRTVGAVGTPEERIALAERTMAEAGLSFPIICKPDVGERGDGVVLVRDRDALATYLRAAGGTTLLQEFVAGEEFGIFYWRMPGAREGRIFSITAKRLPAVTADGIRPLDLLILDDPRLVAQAPIFFRRFEPRLDEVPAAGTQIPLGDRGNHCQGALFLDGMRHATPALTEAVDRLARRFDGFYVGRFDVRVPDVAALEEGRGLVVIELNGVTSEATHIYDPALTVWNAWRTLFAQWRILFAVGRANAARGARPATLGEVLRALRTHRARPKAPPAP